MKMYGGRNSWISGNILQVLLVVVWSFLWFGGPEVKGECIQGVFKQVEGKNLTTMVSSSHHVSSLPFCAKHCLQDLNNCTAFKYRAPLNSLPNCEVLKALWYCNSTGDESMVERSWQYYEAVKDKPPPPCSKLNGCKNRGICVKDPCPSEDFKCICRANFTGKFCEKVNGTFTSCLELLQISSGLSNGVYDIQTESGMGTTKTFCQMTSLEGCAGGGWTMVMKIDGNKKTFVYGSSYWSNKLSYNPIGGESGFDNVETKLPTYWSTSFNEVCIGMKVGSDLRFITIPYAGQSLHSVIAGGKFRATNVGREKWKSLIAGSSLQRNCNKEGFNNYENSKPHTSVRIGIRGNEQKDCKSTDSFLGLGSKSHKIASQCRVERSRVPPTSGNFAGCRPDNGKVNIKSMGYILVR